MFIIYVTDLSTKNKMQRQEFIFLQKSKMKIVGNSFFQLIHFRKSLFFIKIFLLFYMISFFEKNDGEVLPRNMWSTALKNACKRMQFLVGLERAISRKPTSPESLQWLFVPLLLFMLSYLTFTCPKLAQ